MKEKFVKTGFEVLRSTSFVSSLLPAMFVSRFIHKLSPSKKLDAKAELEINPCLNILFEKMLRLEIKMIQSGVNFPVGGSRLIIAKKMAK